MKSNRFYRRELFRLSLALIAIIFTLQGCVVFLTSVATVVMMKGDKHHTTTVLVKKDPITVYSAMIRIIERRPDITVLQDQEENYLIEVTSKEVRATAKATEYGSGLTQLIVTADAVKGDQSDEDLALNVVKQICEELKVAYKVVEN